MLHSYSKILNFGHRLATPVAESVVVAEEKIDGSQFSFGVIDGQLHCRSKGQPLDSSAGLHPEGGVDALFRRSVATAVDLRKRGLLTEGYVYRAEAMRSAKHNTLEYDRAPRGNLILFDVDKSREEYMSYDEKAAEAERLGIEVVPRLYTGRVDMDTFHKLLETESVLGGPMIEGVVLKPVETVYTEYFGGESKALMLKFVSEKFKEIHIKDQRSPNRRDALALVVAKFRTEARWEKAVQHLRDEGKLAGEPKDIGPLLHEVHRDTLEGPDRAEVGEALVTAFERDFKKGITTGLPEWYKEKLVEATFSETESQ